MKLDGTVALEVRFVWYVVLQNGVHVESVSEDVAAVAAEDVYLPFTCMQLFVNVTQLLACRIRTVPTPVHVEHIRGTVSMEHAQLVIIMFII